MRNSQYNLSFFLQGGGIERKTGFTVGFRMNDKEAVSG